jgi:SAM-dependent methyltransferase
MLRRRNLTLRHISRTMRAQHPDAPHMPDSVRLQASAPLQSLFAHELAMLAPILGGVFGNRGLFLRPHAGAPDTLPTHLLGTMLELAVAQPDRLEGAARCEASALPFASESFKLVIAQHVLEQVVEPEEAAAELSRVLAPEGVALILGFNPASPWRLWLNGASARAGVALRIRSAQAWQQVLMREQIDTLQVRYPGPWWPREGLQAAATGGEAHSSRLGRFRSSWLLLARKRRNNLTPLRLRANSRELALKPRLAPGANRACA